MLVHEPGGDTMRRAFGGAGLLLLAVFVLPLFAADDAKETKKEQKKDNGMVYLRAVKGTILNFDDAKKTIRLRVEEPKPDLQAIQTAIQGQQQGQLEYLQASMKRPQDVQGMANAQKKVNDNIAAQRKAMAITTPVEVEWTTTEDLVVRVSDLPQQFDDKGQAKKLTPKEKSDLKGNPKLPGYKGEPSDVHTNDVVAVTLVRSKAAAKIKIDPKAKDIDPAVLAEIQPHVSMILVLPVKK
jgi:hypothetical protein